MKKLLRIAAVTILSLGLTTGVASASHGSSSMIRNTGPHSRNQVRVEKRSRVRVDNRVRANVNNINTQTAVSGDARVSHNTNGGDASTGNADNDNDTSTHVGVSIDNDVADMAGNGSGGDSDNAIINTGPRSNNHITEESSTTVDVDNSANVDVDNDSLQTAVSGDARVSGNTNGEDASTGDASNENETSTSINISF